LKLFIAKWINLLQKGRGHRQQNVDDIHSRILSQYLIC
jgi:hypothetical protein